jgi:2-hydroxychromene-2-carboxylate isomerase
MNRYYVKISIHYIKLESLMAHIDYYMFTLSPFTYLAGSRLEEIAVRNGATINYKPFNLMQVFEKTGGDTPKRSPYF